MVMLSLTTYLLYLLSPFSSRPEALSYSFLRFSEKVDSTWKQCLTLPHSLPTTSTDFGKVSYLWHRVGVHNLCILFVDLLFLICPCPDLSIHLVLLSRSNVSLYSSIICIQCSIWDQENGCLITSHKCLNRQASKLVYTFKKQTNKQKFCYLF